MKLLSEIISFVHMAKQKSFNNKIMYDVYLSTFH